MFGIDDALIWSIIGGALAGGAAAVVIVSVYYLTSSYIKKKVGNEVPETDYVKIENIITSTSGETIGPSLRLSARKRDGTRIKDFEFRYKQSEYFYKGEKISI